MTAPVQRQTVTVTIAPPTPIEGRFVTLEPFAPEVKAELRAALNCDPETWLMVADCGLGDHFEGWWAEAMEQVAAGSFHRYVVRRLADGRVVGTSSFHHLRPNDLGVEIGRTFLHPDARGCAVNPEIKRMMLAHAFEGRLFGAPARRVDFVTDLRNVRSQAAISKLGAVREGVMRHNKVLWTGYVRDTVLYSILDQEWPAVRDRLEARLRAYPRRCVQSNCNVSPVRAFRRLETALETRLSGLPRVLFPTTV